MKIASFYIQESNNTQRGLHTIKVVSEIDHQVQLHKYTFDRRASGVRSNTYFLYQALSSAIQEVYADKLGPFEPQQVDVYVEDEMDQWMMQSGIGDALEKLQTTSPIERVLLNDHQEYIVTILDILGVKSAQVLEYVVPELDNRIKHQLQNE